MRPAPPGVRVRPGAGWRPALEREPAVAVPHHRHDGETDHADDRSASGRRPHLARSHPLQRPRRRGALRGRALQGYGRWRHSSHRHRGAGRRIGAARGASWSRASRSRRCFRPARKSSCVPGCAAGAADRFGGTSPREFSTTAARGAERRAFGRPAGGEPAGHQRSGIRTRREDAVAYRDREVGKRRDRERYHRRVAERRTAGRARDARLRAAGKLRRNPARAREYERERSRRQVEARRKAGLCVRCGTAAAAVGRSSCGPCLATRREADRIRYHKAKKAGLKYGGSQAQSRARCQPQAPGGTPQGERLHAVRAPASGRRRDRLRALPHCET